MSNAAPGGKDPAGMWCDLRLGAPAFLTKEFEQNLGERVGFREHRGADLGLDLGLRERGALRPG